MLPVVALDLQESNSVLDLCAAPGSKTEQIMHYLNSTKGGFLVANDIEHKRLATIQKRFNVNGFDNLALCNENALNLLTKLHGKVSFDRIIVDVPCTGDGTIRKQPHLLKNWKNEDLSELSQLQYNLALVAFCLLKPDGKMVYSTCSLNIKENEQVISKLKEQFKPNFEISQTNFDNFKTRNGLSLANNTNRIFPHDNDTGGFYLATIKKVGSLNKSTVETILKNLNNLKESDKEFQFRDHHKFSKTTRTSELTTWIKSKVQDKEYKTNQLYQNNEHKTYYISKQLKKMFKKVQEKVNFVSIGVLISDLNQNIVPSACSVLKNIYKVNELKFKTKEKETFEQVLDMVEEVFSNETSETNSSGTHDCLLQSQWLLTILSDSIELKNQFEQIEQTSESIICFSFCHSESTKEQKTIPNQKRKLSKHERKKLKKAKATAKSKPNETNESKPTMSKIPEEQSETTIELYFQVTEENMLKVLTSKKLVTLYCNMLLS